MKKTKKQKQEQPAQETSQIESACMAARETYRAALGAALIERWRHAGLGKQGAVMVPASWATGREKHAYQGLRLLLSYLAVSDSNAIPPAYAIVPAVSKTERAQALLDGSDQSTAFGRFLSFNEASLIALAVV